MKNIKGNKKSVIVYNKTESCKTPQQYGGTGIISVADVLHRIIQVGRDDSGLGRWVWIQLQGKEKGNKDCQWLSASIFH